MNWVWGSAFDQLWRLPAFTWVTLAVTAVFALILLISLFHSEKSVANGGLAVVTFLAIGIAAVATQRSVGAGGAGDTADIRIPQSTASLAALACLDGLAGDVVETACEKALFGAAESSAAAVSYTAAQITRLTGFGDSADADNNMTPELSALRRAMERDRYGLVAHVLTVRDGCTASDCLFFRSLTNHNRVAANMTDRSYQGLIERYSLVWSNPTNNGNAVAGSLPPSAPSGKPMSGDFPSSSSIPAVSIMTPELSGPPASAVPALSQKQVPASPSAQLASPRTGSTPPPAPKKPVPKRNAAAPVPVPVQLAPPPQSDD
jgi:hypothetical protein